MFIYYKPNLDTYACHLYFILKRHNLSTSCYKRKSWDNVFNDPFLAYFWFVFVLFKQFCRYRTIIVNFIEIQTRIVGEEGEHTDHLTTTTTTATTKCMDYVIETFFCSETFRFARASILAFGCKLPNLRILFSDTKIGILDLPRKAIFLNN